MSRLGNLGAGLYQGEISIDVIGRRKRWYMLSAVLLLVAVAALGFRGLNLGIEFTGGTVFRIPAPTATVEQVRSAVSEAAGVEQVVVQKAGDSWRAQTEALPADELNEVQTQIAEDFNLSPDQISPTSIGPSWGGQISQSALLALGVFMALVVLYLSMAFEWKMAAAAILALVHDIVITVGLYALIGFEVTPASLIGLLTILGYSLYDTVVVFDKVRENTAGLGSGARMTYSQAANLAVDQTLVRSINTSVVALLPVAAILFVGAGLLGAGTLKDLALVLFIGMAAGTYSSVFIASPFLADLKEREPAMQALAKRVTARQASAGKEGKKGRARAARREDPSAEAATEAEPEDDQEPQPASAGASTRRVVQQGPRRQPSRKGSKRRPGGKKRK
ncbi:MAG: protein translocase subunit SecF [Streptosporangiales bacterium]|nr:protein translocase subunit SecF [Streptosporangiales bacterium]